MPNTQIVQFTAGKPCLPILNSDLARQIAVPLQAGAYGAGTILGQITAANVNAVQTVTSTLTGGSFKLFLSIAGLASFTGSIAFNATGATYAGNIQTALNALIQTVYPSGSVVVTGTGPFVVTFGGTLAGMPITLMTVDNTLATGGTASVANTTTGVGPNGFYRAYASGNTDGSQNPTGILQYPAFVDNAGNLFVTTATTGPVSEFGQSDLSLPMWYRGDFDFADLVGLDAGGLAALFGRFITGSLASTKGIVHIG